MHSFVSEAPFIRLRSGASGAAQRGTAMQCNAAQVHTAMHKSWARRRKYSARNPVPAGRVRFVWFVMITFRMDRLPVAERIGTQLRTIV